MKPFFSSRPGCFERHLQRKSYNVLFPEAERFPDQEEINAARKRDEADVQQFYRDFRAIMEEMGKLSPHVDSGVILGFKERLDRLYEVCAGLPGSHEQDKAGIQKVYGLIAAQILRGADQDPYAKWQLEQEGVAREMHLKLLEFPLVADLLRPDTPIGKDELVPTLLSEEDEAVRAAMALFNPEQRQALVARAEALLDRLQAEGHELPSARLRLQAMAEPMEL